MLIYAPGKGEARVAASPISRALSDTLLCGVTDAILARYKSLGSVPGDAAMDYLSRKKVAIKASYYRATYGRDYWTGRPRRFRRNGYDNRTAGEFMAPIMAKLEAGK